MPAVEQGLEGEAWILACTLLVRLVVVVLLLLLGLLLLLLLRMLLAVAGYDCYSLLCSVAFCTF